MIKASIVIPTKNAGSHFEEVLSAIFSQIVSFEYEVICVDSGSTDETTKIISRFPARLYSIQPCDFGHGKTRNYGASLGTGDYIVFITQDALPASDAWLEELVGAMGMGDDIAGAFGRHLPYPDCNIFDARDINGLFASFGIQRKVISIDDWAEYKSHGFYYRFLSFFSDNNACIKRSIWEKYPYPEVDFAEDQVWMRKMLEIGYKKVYAPDAPVFHSHNYRLIEQFNRAYDEQQACYGLYDGYLIVNGWRHVPRAIASSVKRDFQYTNTRSSVFCERLKWKNYAIWNNIGKIAGGYLGGKSNLFSDSKRRRTDKLFSQRVHIVKSHNESEC